MIILSVLILFSLPVGFIVGWYSRCTYKWLIVRCAVASLVLMVAIGVINEGIPHPLLTSDLPDAVVYLAIPYAVFFLAPSIVGGLIAAAIRKRIKRSKS
jgi:hypothetical protein